MTIIRTEADGTVTANWGGHEIRDARRGFWNKGERCWNRPEFRNITVSEESWAGRASDALKARKAARLENYRRMMKGDE